MYLTRILSTASVSSAHHLIIDDDVDAIGFVPPLAESVVDDWHVDGLQGLWPQSRS
jgi:hypothetical protein